MRIQGTVEKGLGIAGPLLGTPTANLALEAPPPLPWGVHAAMVLHDDAAWPAVVCYGADEQHKKFEVHLIDWQGTLVGETLTVDVIAKIRDLVPWESVDQMRALIQQDIIHAKSICSSYV